jgi:hypothetical protein
VVEAKTAQGASEIIPVRFALAGLAKFAITDTLRRLEELTPICQLEISA